MVESIEGDNLNNYLAKIHYLNQDKLQLIRISSVFAELTILWTQCSGYIQDPNSFPRTELNWKFWKIVFWETRTFFSWWSSGRFLSWKRVDILVKSQFRNAYSKERSKDRSKWRFRNQRFCSTLPQKRVFCSKDRSKWRNRNQRFCGIFRKREFFVPSFLFFICGNS